MTSPIQVLAKYLTASGRVVGHSIGLQLGGREGHEAKDFYALRDAFGVTGYITSDEAETSIIRSLQTHRTHAMTRDEWLQIVGLITNIQTRRFKLTRNGEEVEFTTHEEEAMAKFRSAWAGGQIEWTS